jgi:aminopeptidase-like protein
MMMEIFKELAGLPRHINSPAYDYSIEKLSREYGFKIFKYDTDQDHLGWEIPPKYSVSNAYIKKNGATIYNATDHPLKVISYSASFSGVVNKEELVKHCFYDHRNDDWIPYHFRQSYRPWDRDWGFCVPKKFLDTLEEGDYEVLIETLEGEKELKIGKGVAKGRSPISFALCAHLDHPGLANDDLSGVLVVLEVFKRLKKRNLAFSVEVFIVPEIIGPQYYLNENRAPYEGLFVESVGQDGNFVLQSSLKGGALIDTVASNVIKNAKGGNVVPFRTVYGNDEINFETYGCPMASLTRGKFEGYHSDLDCFDNIIPEKMSEAVNVVEEIVLNFQNEIIVEKKYKGLPSLAHPNFNLYIDPGQVAFGINSENSILRKVMDVIPTMSNFFSLAYLLDQIGCEDETEQVMNYLKKWKDKGLLELHGNF